MNNRDSHPLDPYQVLNIHKPPLKYVNKFKCIESIEKKYLNLACRVFPPKEEKDQVTLDIYLEAYNKIRRQFQFYQITQEDMERSLTVKKWKRYIAALEEEFLLSLKSLDFQIRRLKKLSTSGLVEDQKKIFIQKLTDFRKEVEINLSGQIEDLKSQQVLNREDIDDANEKMNSVRSSEGMFVLNDMTMTLKKLDYTHHHQFKENILTLQQTEERYQQKCKTNTSWKNFAKAIGSVVTAGVGFIAGAVMAGIATAFVAVFNFPTIFLLPVTMYMVGCEVAHSAYNAFDIQEGSLTHFLTGKTPLYTAATEVTHAGCTLFSRRETEPKKYKEETPKTLFTPLLGRLKQT